MALLSAPGCIAVGGVVAVRAISSVASNGKKLIEVKRYQSLEHTGPVVLDVSTVNGSITVKPNAGKSVEIDATFRMIDRKRADAVNVKVVREPAHDDRPGHLTLAPDWPGGKPLKKKGRGEGASFVVRIPSTTRLILKASNGSIALEGLAGPAEIDTSNGSIKVTDHAGGIAAETSNGSVTIIGNTGPVEIDTSNGRVEVTGSPGPIKVDTSNGSIEVALPPDASGPVSLDTSNGSIALTVGPGFGGELLYDTSNAKVRLKGLKDAQIEKKGKRKGVIRFANPGKRSRLDTSNGSITVKQEG